MPQNGYHIQTMTENSKEYLCLTIKKLGKICIKEKMSSYSSGLYYTRINPIIISKLSSTKVIGKTTFSLWHDMLGHPGPRMLTKIIKDAHAHPMKNINVIKPSNFPCIACSLGKIITRPSVNKIKTELPGFLVRIQEDICGTITPYCRPFRYL